LSVVPDDDRHSLTELADLAGVTPRTVRYYLGQGLLPAVGQTGPGNKYAPGHLTRLRLIRRLQAEHLPLAEIRHRLDGLAEDEIRDLAASREPAPPTDSALDYLRTVLGGPTSGPTEPVRGERRPAAAVTTGLARTPATSFERSNWERVVLGADVELHIRRPLSRAQNKQVDRLVTIARELLEEDHS
jgi:DNA-binding transcriptional MerR regulator